MASGVAVAVTIIFTLSTMQGVVVLGGGGLECEKLPVEMCAFAVSSSGARCLLEKKYSPTSLQYECHSSNIMADKIMEWIESEECLEACGLERMTVGLSSDDLSENSLFTRKLCSDKCQNSCPNIVDLFLNLAAGEGLYLPQLCEDNKKISRRVMYDEIVAEAPTPTAITVPSAI